MKRIVVLAALAALGGCSITLPVLVVPEKGKPLRGVNEVSLSGGSFSVTDGNITCTGKYDAWDTATVKMIPTQCSDGRTGTITAIRDKTEIKAEGTIAMSDGTTAKFYVGEAAGLK